MELWAIVIGIAVAVGLGAYLHNRKPAGMGRALQAVAIVAAGALSAAVAGVGLKYLASSDRAPAIEAAMQTMRETHLLGLVLKENPALDARFREAIEAELRAPTRIGPQRTFVVGGEVRRDIIIPALRRADDATALRAITAMQAFTKHLQGSNVALCKEFGVVGLQQPGRLDAAGAALFKRALGAQEEAYLSGKSRPVAPQQITDQEVRRLLTDAGYTAADFETLTALGKTSDADGCAATVKLYMAPTLLPPRQGGVLARYLLTIS